jgi:putative oxidoreductase
MNSKVTMALRIVLGLILIIFGANKFVGFMPAPELSESANNFWSALVNTGYIFPLMGFIEVIAGLLLVIKKWVPFALILFAPIAVNFMFFHLVLAPSSIGPAALASVLTIILIYSNWDNYKALFN